jgi:hypothetical protein
VINELLFLGQIPGTNFQITFNEMAALADIALLVLIFRKRHFLRRANFFVHILRISLVIKKGQQLSLPL